MQAEGRSLVGMERRLFFFVTGGGPSVLFDFTFEDGFRLLLPEILAKNCASTSSQYSLVDAAAVLLSFLPVTFGMLVISLLWYC